MGRNPENKASGAKTMLFWPFWVQNGIVLVSVTRKKSLRVSLRSPMAEKMEKKRRRKKKKKPENARCEALPLGVVATGL